MSLEPIQFRSPVEFAKEIKIKRAIEIPAETTGKSFTIKTSGSSLGIYHPNNDSPDIKMYDDGGVLIRNLYLFNLHLQKGARPRDWSDMHQIVRENFGVNGDEGKGIFIINLDLYLPNNEGSVTRTFILSKLSEFSKAISSVISNSSNGYYITYNCVWNGTDYDTNLLLLTETGVESTPDNISYMYINMYD